MPTSTGTRALTDRFASRLWLGVALFVVTFLTFARIHRFDFIGFDDPLYVNHPRVMQGLTAENVAWAMVAADASNWHPLTWLSHMLDVQLWGMNPSPPHLVNAVLHALNALLLFLVLERLTARRWLALIAAALFAVHPLRVESVAWVAERKDLLCALFSLLTIAAYAACAKRPSLPRYLTVTGLFALALMSKPMAVTLPFVLLLLDYWPLGRMRLNQRAMAPGGAGTTELSDPAGSFASNLRGENERRACSTETLPRLIAEKLPLLVLALAGSLLTVSAQAGGGAMVSLTRVSLAARGANAALAYIRYIGKTLWPADLIILYPLHIHFPAWAVVAAVAALALTTVAALLASRRQPFFIVGWLWFLGTLVPVIGIVQVGAQSIADRYTYIPCIGLVVIAVWGIAAFVERSRIARGIAVGAAAAALIVLIALTQHQLNYWQGGTMTLFQHALDVDPDNAIAQYEIGYVLSQRGQADAAMAHVLRARELAPRYAKIHYLLGHLLRERGRLDDAVAAYRASLALDPKFPLAWQELGATQELTGDRVAAANSLAKALELNPDSFYVKQRLSRLRAAPTARAD
jgi:hypothetical protein